jgi:ubiquinone/menaquinone biosynthesis C-methylase UbiE
MAIDIEKIHAIENQYGSLDPMEAYYRKRALTYEVESPLVPKTRDLLEQALRGVSRVLDVGCGDAQTLLSCADLFERGTGLDQSAYILGRAQEEVRQKGIDNVHFVLGKAWGLPFDADSFDLVFSERGPLGHSDWTMAEALRVLKSGGRIFIETGVQAGPGRTLLTDLDEERDRLERFGVRIEILASRVLQQRFRDLYEWFEMRCMTWRYFETEPPFPYTEQMLNEVAETAGGAGCPVLQQYQTIWAGGHKVGQHSAAG